MTFEEWWNGTVYTDKDCAKDAWDYQQTIIDELQYLNKLQQDRIDRLEASWRDDDSLTLAYLRGFSDGKKEAQEQE